MQENLEGIRGQNRQGDVLLDPVDKIPETAKLLPESTRIVLAEGEVTGHAHVIKPEKGEVRQYRDGEDLYLEVLKPVKLMHEDHDWHLIEPRFYRLRRQTENWLGEVTQVAD